jgi:hypothetical protein
LRSSKIEAEKEKKHEISFPMVVNRCFAAALSVRRVSIAAA